MVEDCPNGGAHRVRAKLQESLGDGRVRCLACPRKCVIPEGMYGLCKSKLNVEGTLCEVNYGMMSGVAMDPIEKKPLFHFMPGSRTYSIGTVGCNLFCEHCQNWVISQSEPESFTHLTYLPPEEAIEEALNYGASSIAFTYNEPTVVSMEWVCETAELARRNGLATVSVTNGYWSEEARERLIPLIDAANVDVKAFTDDFYRRVAKAPFLKPVLDTVIALKRAGKHVELTYLIIPGYNDGEDEIRAFSRWVVREVSSDTPVHFSRFFPHYRMKRVPPTPVDTIRRAVKIAKEEGVKYVYAGNVPGDPSENTYCPECGTLLIRRYGFSIERCNLTEDGRCPNCGELIPIVGRCRTSGGLLLI
ncbi:MAG: AmmeMemoRadiSam system radical SAM enzyme [Candidatus Korarchaeum sp.]